MRLIILSVMTFWLVSATGQQQHPSSLKWNKIETSHFKIIFSEDNEFAAQKAANLLENNYLKVSSPLNVEAKKIPLLIKSESVISNGYVTLGPRHMAWYITPFQNCTNTLDGSDWFQTLTLHEYRHVSQFDKLDEGFTDIVSDLTGDLGKSILITISTPIWFFEGDAIQSETINSLQGRGRTPSFLAGHYCLENENIRYSYNKSYFGSYKDFTPNHYHLGYILTSHINRNYGSEVWPQLLSSVSKRSYSPFSFSGSLKRITEYNLNKTYHNTMDEVKSIWDAEKDHFNSNEEEFHTILKKEPDCWTNYSFAYALKNGDYIALKSDFKDIKALTIIDSTHENKLLNISPNERIHSNGKEVVWSATFTDIRWGERSYSDIIVYNLATNQKTRITKRQKYFAPAISSDGKKIAAIELSADANCSLVILNALSGEKIQSYNFNMNVFARMPSWSENDSEIVFTSTKGQLKTLNIYNVNDNKVKQITPPQSENITNPVFFNEYILYNTPIAGIDEIHAIHIESGKRFRVTSGSYGVYNPSVNTLNSELIFEEYTLLGKRLKTMTIDSKEWTQINPKQEFSLNYLNRMFPIEIDSSNSLNTATINEFEVEKYGPLLNSIFVHSWSPRITMHSIGAMAFSNDILNTTSIVAGIDYYSKEMAHREYLNLSYAGLYPVLSTEISFGQIYKFLPDSLGNNEEVETKMNEKLIAGSINLPLDFSTETFTNLFSVSGTYLYSYLEPKNDSILLSGQKSQTLSAININAEGSFHRQMAYRDLYPRLGQDFSFNITNSVGNNSFSGSRLTARGVTYLPGVLKNHSTRISYGYEKNSSDYINSVYLLDKTLEPVRGYQMLSDFSSLKRITFDYSFPLFYPDINMGAFMYIKRIHNSIFYDRGNYSNSNNNLFLESVGIDVNFEFYFLRIPVPIEVGVRYSKRFYDDLDSFEVLLFRMSL